MNLIHCYSFLRSARGIDVTLLSADLDAIYAACETLSNKIINMAKTNVNIETLWNIFKT